MKTMKKILIIGQAPPAVKQVVPYDTTMLYEILDWVNISKEAAQHLFELEACTDTFPGFDEHKNHLPPTIEQFMLHFNSTLKAKMEAADKILILGRVAFNRMHNPPAAELISKKEVMTMIHPSKRNRHFLLKDRAAITAKLNKFIYE